MSSGTTEHTVTDFSQEYLALRRQEERLYTDEEVLYLPRVAVNHPHYKEWQLRKESCDRLIHHLGKRKNSIQVLEVGCGNGWLCHQLAGLHLSRVTGMDTGNTELQQARRVFSHIPNLQFVQGSIHAKEIEGSVYDIIVFAASFQYFSSTREIIGWALQKLKPGGELHILDTPFYTVQTIEAAKKNTRRYYERLGFPGMAKHYFHHGLHELDSFRTAILYHPSFFGHHFLGNRNPFPWICIKNRESR